MRSDLLALSLVFLALAGFGQVSVQPKTGAIIGWENQSHDFGEIQQGEKVEHTYTLVNQGTEPLVITNIQVTCGCTTPKGWPRDPIAPGQKADITVAFNSAGKFGRQNKVVTIISNAVGGPSQIKFSAMILDKKLSN